MKILLAVLLFSIYYFQFAIPVKATFLCEPVYGGGLSEFCIQKPILPSPKKEEFPVFPAPVITKTPPTGPEALPIVIFFSSGLLGYLLKRKI